MKFKIDGFGFFWEGQIGIGGIDLTDAATIQAVDDNDPALFDAAKKYLSDDYPKACESAYVYKMYGHIKYWAEWNYATKEELLKLANNELLEQTERSKIQSVIDNEAYTADEIGRIIWIGKPDKSGYVYLMHSWHTGKHKIGCSVNPANRLSQIKQDKKDYTIILIHQIEADDQFKAEACMHEVFKEKRIGKTEWFDLDEDDIQQIVQTVSYRDNEFSWERF
jgi:hypothetical protein